MGVKLIRAGDYAPSPQEKILREAFASSTEPLTFEWVSGQYWLHSNREGERPIGIEVSRELERHRAYFKKSSLQRELLARAIGVRGPHRPFVWDLTAGLLSDTLLFLSFGCRVRAFERHPVVALLIESALANAQDSALERLEVTYSDAQDLLQGSPPEVIYFDPMFEDANTKTAPKKEMRIFRECVGRDADAEAILERALNFGPKRVVVKRPKHSAPLGREADVVYAGKATRYDVYLPRTVAFSPEIS